MKKVEKRLVKNIFHEEVTRFFVHPKLGLPPFGIYYISSFPLVLVSSRLLKAKSLRPRQKRGKTVGFLVCLVFWVFIISHNKAQAFCFEEAGAMYGISPRVLYAIAKVESNFNPKAINKNKNGTYDFGVMQINSSWSKVLGRENWLRLGDPCFNVKVGAWVLAQCIQKYGQTWEAVGCYNANSKDKRKKYAWKVYSVIVGNNNAKKM